MFINPDTISDNFVDAIICINAQAWSSHFPHLEVCLYWRKWRETRGQGKRNHFLTFSPSLFSRFPCVSFYKCVCFLNFLSSEQLNDLKTLPKNPLPWDPSPPPLSAILRNPGPRRPSCAAYQRADVRMRGAVLHGRARVSSAECGQNAGGGQNLQTVVRLHARILYRCWQLRRELPTRPWRASQGHNDRRRVPHRFRLLRRQPAEHESLLSACAQIDRLLLCLSLWIDRGPSDAASSGGKKVRSLASTAKAICEAWSENAAERQLKSSSISSFILLSVCGVAGWMIALESWRLCAQVCSVALACCPASLRGIRTLFLSWKSLSCQAIANG